MIRIGIFGGTFNPIHCGHLTVADDVKSTFRLDRIIFIPSAVPPHKMGNLAPADDRLAMVRLALGNRRGMEASDIELMRLGPSYTVDTLTRLRDIHTGSRLFFILGIDAFKEIETWKDYRELFTLAAIIVMSRPDACAPWRSERGIIEFLTDFLKSRISEGYRLDAFQGRFVDASGRPVYMADVEPVRLSATEIRERVGTGRSIDGLVPPAVADYILRKGLYQ
jgi:nicotinate-nucleotide adenylyltransferase